MGPPPQRVPVSTERPHASCGWPAAKVAAVIGPGAMTPESDINTACTQEGDHSSRSRWWRWGSQLVIRAHLPAGAGVHPSRASVTRQTWAIGGCDSGRRCLDRGSILANPSVRRVGRAKRAPPVDRRIMAGGGSLRSTHPPYRCHPVEVCSRSAAAPPTRDQFTFCRRHWIVTVTTALFHWMAAFMLCVAWRLCVICLSARANATMVIHEDSRKDAKTQRGSSSTAWSGPASFTRTRTMLGKKGKQGEKVKRSVCFAVRQETHGTRTYPRQRL